jgi:hypothetical protein
MALDLLDATKGNPKARRALLRGQPQIERRSTMLAAATTVPYAVRYMALVYAYLARLRDERLRAYITAVLYQTCLDVGRWPRPTLATLYDLSPSAVDRPIADARRVGFLLRFNVPKHNCAK